MKIIKTIIITVLWLSFINLAQSAQATPITLNYNDIPIRQALQFIAQASHQNIIISGNVKGNVTIHLDNMSAQNALAVILQEAGLGQQMMGNTVMVAPLQDLTQHEKMQEDLQNLGLLHSALIPLHYAKAQDIITSLKNNTVLSPRGTISADTRTNSLWIQDTRPKLMTAQNFIHQIDIPVQQVLIKARIVSVDQHHEQELGVKFGLHSPTQTTLKNGFAIDLPTSLPTAPSMGIVLATFGKNRGLLNLELSALENEGAAKIISSPQLMTANQQPATILAGQEIPYQQATTSGATSVSFQKAVVSLTVTPQITPTKKFILNLTVNQDRPSGTLIHGEPVIDTRHIQTIVTVNNNETIVLGGIYEKNNEKQVEGVPFLDKLPILGGLFRHSVTKSNRRELLIFITPQLAKI